MIQTQGNFNHEWIRKAPPSPFIAPDSLLTPFWEGRKVTVELYNPEGKIEQLSAYSLNPYQQTWWQRLVLWVNQLLFGRMTVLIKVEGETDLQHVRVDELSRLFRQPAYELRREFPPEPLDATAYLRRKQLTFTLNKIEKAALEHGLILNSEDKEKIKKIVEHVPFENVARALDLKNFDQARLITTLLKIGEIYQRSITLSMSKKERTYRYAFDIDQHNIYISKVERGVQTTINLFNGALQERPLPPEELKRHLNDQAPVQPSTLEGQLKQLAQQIVDPHFLERKNVFEQLTLLAQASQIQLMTKKSFEALTRRVHPENLLISLNQMRSKQAKQVLFNTFNAIGQQLCKSPGIFSRRQPVYVKKQKDPQGDTLTHAFAINKNEIFINGEKFAEGSYKIVSDAILLNDLSKPMVRLKFKENDQDSQKQFRLEDKLLQELHNTRNPYLVLPYHCRLISHSKTASNQLIVFQPKQGTEGEGLMNTFAIHLLNALKEVALGLDLLHKAHYIHCDLKPENFLIEGDLQSQIPAKAKLTDFGMTVKKGMPIKGGSPFYMPIKALTGTGTQQAIGHCRADENIDWFAFGVTILQLLSRNQVEATKCIALMSEEEKQSYLKSIQNLINQEHEPLSQERQVRLSLLALAEQVVSNEHASLADLRLSHLPPISFYSNNFT